MRATMIYGPGDIRLEEVGNEVTSVNPGDFVIAPFALSDGTCANCRNGVTTSCLHGAYWGSPDGQGFLGDGGQGERARVAEAYAAMDERRAIKVLLRP